MAVRQIIHLGGQEFRRKGDAVGYLQSMLYSYELGQEVSSDDAKVLAELLGRHPEASTKIGPGIENFEVRSADFGTRCFWVRRIDGTREKFSFRACL